MMNRIFKSALVSLGVLLSVVVGLAFPAWAETPQTDVQFIQALGGQPTDKVLAALAVYYDLHVLEIGVQLTREQNTGAFFAARRAEGDGDNAEAQRQMDMFESTKAALADARKANQGLRQKLADMTGIAFADDLAVAPDVPDALPAAHADAPADLLTARAAAWAQVEAARQSWREMRLQLLEDQERYDKTREVKLGDSMRAMTRAEVAMARAACDFRLIEAKTAAATGQPLADVLAGL